MFLTTTSTTITTTNNTTSMDDYHYAYYYYLHYWCESPRPDFAHKLRASDISSQNEPARRTASCLDQASSGQSSVSIWVTDAGRRTENYILLTIQTLSRCFLSIYFFYSLENARLGSHTHAPPHTQKQSDKSNRSAQGRVHHHHSQPRESRALPGWAIRICTEGVGGGGEPNNNKKE